MSRNLIFGSALASTIVVAVFLACSVPPTYAKVKTEFLVSDAGVYDRAGDIIAQVRVDNRGRRLPWLEIDEISPSLVEAVIASEDRRFYMHPGVDLGAVAAALWGNFANGAHRGASTISMQVASVLAHGGWRRGWWQKFAQMAAAVRLEVSWTKQEILTAYLNLVTFRGELQGVNAAARGLFRKHAHGLSTAEAKILSVLIRSPNAPWEKVRARACQSDCTGIDDAIHSIRDREVSDTSNALAPHFARRFAGGHSERRFSSTLDRNLQLEALRLVGEQLRLLRSHNVHDSSVLVIDNASGEILAYVGNLPELSSAPAIDGVQTRRQAGSTLKSILYAAAFEKRILSPDSLLSDLPFEVDTGRGIYRPQNYDHQYREAVSVREALASSMNVPAVRALALLGPESFVDWLSRLGFGRLNSGEDYGTSLALGTADITLWELVRAYRVFANDGVFSELRAELGSGNGGERKRIFSLETSRRIADILSDREARSSTFGLENPLATRYWTAVKTGTSKDMRDNWCVGFSRRYTVGVWVGNFSGEAMWDVSGISGAAPIWVGLMNYLHARDSSEPPPGIAGEPARLPRLAGGFQKILQPASGAVTVWDPDIPPARQKILFESTAALPGFKWRLDGRILADANQPYLWSPTKGRHSLALVGPQGRKEDEVVFTVRR